MMLSNLMTANSLDEKPANQANSKTTKMMRLLAPAFPFALDTVAVAVGGFDLFVTPACTIFAVNTHKHDTHTTHMGDSSLLVTDCFSPTKGMLRGRCVFVLAALPGN